MLILVTWGGPCVGLVLKGDETTRAALRGSVRCGVGGLEREL
jgi:hypothetical protein